MTIFFFVIFLEETLSANSVFLANISASQERGVTVQNSKSHRFAANPQAI